MTALGFLYPGHSGEDDYPRIEQLLGSDIRGGPGAHGHRRGRAPGRRAAGDGPRRSGSRRVWRSCGSPAPTPWCGPVPAEASCTAGRAPRNRCAPWPRRRASRPPPPPSPSCTRRRRSGRAGSRSGRPTRMTWRSSSRSSCVPPASRRSAWSAPASSPPRRSAPGPSRRYWPWPAPPTIRTRRRSSLPDTALHTAAHIPALEKELGKPVLTANQVTVWEGLRLADRRVNAPELGALFIREPVVQA